MINKKHNKMDSYLKWILKKCYVICLKPKRSVSLFKTSKSLTSCPRISLNLNENNYQLDKKKNEVVSERYV